MKTLTIPATEAKKHLPDYLARSAQCRIVVTRRGRPIAAIVGLDDLREIEQASKRRGLASLINRWEGFEEIVDEISLARTLEGDSRAVSL